MKKRVMIFALLVLVVSFAFSVEVVRGEEPYYTPNCGFLITEKECGKYFTQQIGNEGLASYKCSWNTGGKVCNKVEIAITCDEVNSAFDGTTLSTEQKQKFCNSFYYKDYSADYYNPVRDNCIWKGGKCIKGDNCVVGCKPSNGVCIDCVANSYNSVLQSQVQPKLSTCSLDRCLEYYSNVVVSNFQNTVQECLPFPAYYSGAGARASSRGYVTECNNNGLIFCVSESERGTNCNDGIDNDCDGKIDLCDSDCNAQAREDNNVKCNDKIDNDCDNKIDCADEDCDGKQCTFDNQKGKCVAKSCVKVSLNSFNADLNLDNEYFNSLPVEKSGYLKATKIPKQEVKGLDWNSLENCNRNSDCRQDISKQGKKLRCIETNSWKKNDVCCWQGEEARFVDDRFQCFKKNSNSNVDDKIDYDNNYKKDFLVVSPYDTLKCSSVASINVEYSALQEFAYSGDNSVQSFIRDLKNSKIKLAFELENKGETKECKVYSSQYSSGYLQLTYLCDAKFELGDEARGTKQSCKIYFDSLILPGAKKLELNKDIEMPLGTARIARSSPVVIAKYLFYFVKANQKTGDKDSWEDVNQQFSVFESLSKINDDVSSAGKKIFIDIPLDFKKKEYMNTYTFEEAKKEPGQAGKEEIELCKVKKDFAKMAFEIVKLRQNPYGKIKDNIAKSQSSKEDRFIVVSSNIVDEYSQCKTGILGWVERKLRRTGEDIGILPGAVLFLFKETVNKKETKKPAWLTTTSQGTGQFLATPITGAIKLVDRKETEGFIWFINRPYELIAGLGQALVGTTKQEISYPFGKYMIIKTRHLDEFWVSRDPYPLAKALSRSYEGLCYEDNLLIYSQDSKQALTMERECTNKFPECCIDSIGEKILGAVFRVSKDSLGIAISLVGKTVVDLSGFMELNFETRRSRFWNSCGATFECPGWPLKFCPDKKIKSLKEPISVMGVLGTTGKKRFVPVTQEDEIFRNLPEYKPEDCQGTKNIG